MKGLSYFGLQRANGDHLSRDRKELEKQLLPEGLQCNA